MAPNQRVVDERLAEALGAIANLNDTMLQASRVIATMNAAQITGALSHPIVAGISQSLSQSAGRLIGYSLRETTGSDSAIVRLRDGVDTGGVLLATISLSPGESTRDIFMPQGIGFANGLYVEIVSGTVEGTCWLRAAR